MPHHETYVTDAPWVIINYVVTDEEADAAGGKTHVVLECCICGDERPVEFDLPPADVQIPSDGLPETKAKLNAYVAEHLHEDSHKHPMLTWARPLRNPAAFQSGIPIDQLKRRLSLELQKN